MAEKRALWEVPVDLKLDKAGLRNPPDVKRPFRSSYPEGMGTME